MPADMRLIEAVSLKVEEVSLAGEPVPVDKEHASFSMKMFRPGTGEIPPSRAPSFPMGEAKGLQLPRA